MQIPGVPVIYGLKNSLFIDQPSAHQREFVKSTEERRMHMSEPEYYKLHEKESKDELTSAKLNDDSANEASGSEHMRKSIGGGHALGVVDKTKFKRKKAKVWFSLEKY